MISAAIITLNEEKYLERCLASLVQDGLLVQVADEGYALP